MTYTIPEPMPDKMVQVGKKHRVEKVLNESVLTWQDNPAATEIQDVMLLVQRFPESLQFSGQNETPEVT